MADYYPLISRAIAGLDPSAPGEQRRALYERARSALIAQLRTVQPPLTESEITRERLSLEEAVRKVESEAAQRARDISRGAPRNRGGDAFRASSKETRSRANAAPPRGEGEDESPRSETPRSERPQRTLRVDPPPIPPTPQQRPQSPAGEAPQRPGAQRPSSNDPQAPGVRGFRDITADANDLGRAAAQANRSARRTYANVPSPTPEFDRVEPNMEDRAGEYDDLYGPDEPAGDDESRAAPTRRSRFAPGGEGKPKRSRGLPTFPFKSAIIVGIVLILAGAGILWGPKLYTVARNMLKSQPATTTTTTTETPKDSPTAPKPKITDRVGQPSEQTAPVAQRVVLYDEDPADPKGKQYVGTAVWRTEQVKGANGSGDVAVRADIDIPERKFKMTISFRRNTDSSLPASHTAELTFMLPPNFDGGGIANVPGILMKSNEQARGTPLAGLAVKVTDGFFLIGLSNVDADRARNIQLLKERSWFDVPLVYTNQRRAIIAIEKGSPGERAFNDAFAAWGE